MDIFWKIFKDIAIGFGKGAAIGFTALAVFTIIGLPVSYVANRYIYHSSGMRGLLCLVAAVLSIPILLCMMIYQYARLATGTATKVHYFEYLPFIYKGDGESATGATGDEYGIDWIASLFWRTWYWIRNTLLEGFINYRDTPADQAAFRQACTVGLVPEALKNNPKYVILEQAVEFAQLAAQTPGLACFQEIEMLQKTLRRLDGVEPAKVEALQRTVQEVGAVGAVPSGCLTDAGQTPMTPAPAPKEVEMAPLAQPAGASV